MNSSNELVEIRIMMEVRHCFPSRVAVRFPQHIIDETNEDDVFLKLAFGNSAGIANECPAGISLLIRKKNAPVNKNMIGRVRIHIPMDAEVHPHLCTSGIS